MAKMRRRMEGVESLENLQSQNETLRRDLEDALGRYGFVIARCFVVGTSISNLEKPSLIAPIENCNILAVYDPTAGEMLEINWRRNGRPSAT